MLLRRVAAALAVPGTLVSAACLAAPANLPGPTSQSPERAPMRPSLDIAEPTEWRDPQAQRAGMARAWDISEGVEFGIGRYVVPEIARPATNMERVRPPLDIRSRSSSIGGVGISMRF